MKTKFFLLTVLLFGLVTQKGIAQNWRYDITTPVSLQNPTLLENDDVAPIIFGTDGTPQMILSTNGQLGIGPSFTPTYMLDVDGDIDIAPTTSGLLNGGTYLLYAGSPTADNLFVGIGAFPGITNVGSDNTFVGASTGIANTGGTEDTYIGAYAGSASGFSSVTNTTCVGYNSGAGAATVGSSSVYLGNNSTADAYVNVAWSSYSDRRIKDNIKENVPGLAFINKLHPVTYNLNVHRENQLTGVTDNKDWPGKYDIEKITQSGFIAQQVDSAAQACGYDFNGVKRPKSAQGLYALAYTDFVVPLVKAVQELSAKHDSLSKAVQTMQACLNQLCGTMGDNNPANRGTPASIQTIALSSTNVPLLYQNTPNPFNSGTKINYYLPEGTMGGTIVFFDINGNQIKTMPLTQTGFGTLNITSDNLGNGIYSYSLIVNGNTIDSKRMVVQR